MLRSARAQDTTQTGLNSNLASTSHTYSHSGAFFVTHVIKDSLSGACLDSTSHIGPQKNYKAYVKPSVNAGNRG